jgi:hypothetical protein
LRNVDAALDITLAFRFVTLMRNFDSYAWWVIEGPSDGRMGLVRISRDFLGSSVPLIPSSQALGYAFERSTASFCAVGNLPRGLCH